MHILQNVEDLRGEHIPAQNGVVGEPLLRSGLLIHVGDLKNPLLQGGDLHGGVAGDGLGGHLLHPHGGGAVFLRGLHQLEGHRLFRPHDVVAQQHGKGLVPHEAAGPADGVAQALRLLLAHIEDVGQVGGPAHLHQLRLLPRLEQAGLQLGVVVKIVVHGRLGPVGDDQDVLDAGGHRLLDDILDHRLVHHGEHLLGDGLGGGEHPGAQPGGGDDGLAYFHKEISFIVLEPRQPLLGDEGAERSDLGQRRNEDRSQNITGYQLPQAHGKCVERIGSGKGTGKTGLKPSHFCPHNNSVA